MLTRQRTRPCPSGAVGHPADPVALDGLH
jgi:hypothetical protein